MSHLWPLLSQAGVSVPWRGDDRLMCFAVLEQYFNTLKIDRSLLLQLKIETCRVLGVNNSATEQEIEGCKTEVHIIKNGLDSEITFLIKLLRWVTNLSFPLSFTQSAFLKEMIKHPLGLRIPENVNFQTREMPPGAVLYRNGYYYFKNSELVYDVRRYFQMLGKGFDRSTTVYRQILKVYNLYQTIVDKLDALVRDCFLEYLKVNFILSDLPKPIPPPCRVTHEQNFSHRIRSIADPQLVTLKKDCRCELDSEKMKKVKEQLPNLRFIALLFDDSTVSYCVSPFVEETLEFILHSHQKKYRLAKKIIRQSKK